MSDIHLERPMSGKAQKLWDWFTKHAILDKPVGTEPTRLTRIRAGRAQKSQGAAQYEILWGKNRFFVYDINETLSRTTPKVLDMPRLDDAYYI